MKTDEELQSQLVNNLCSASRDFPFIQYLSSGIPMDLANVGSI